MEEQISILLSTWRQLKAMKEASLPKGRSDDYEDLRTQGAISQLDDCITDLESLLA